ncbi:MAG TPA: hypothetical protein VFV95_11765 [Vicinamibacterales bacterium]|nr:hypothetical protein [Vicinamibacterales bacterium]
MTGEECFDVWAPADAAWSEWAKPALFAHMAPAEMSGAATDASGEVDAFWVPDGGGRTAIVVDLPADASVAFGLALGRRGYRPVPVYNTSLGPSAVVDAAGVARALMAGAMGLRDVGLRRDAPPAFLLDSERMAPSVPPGPGKFDNRWLVFPQDFPSAARLQGGGVHDVLLVHGDRGLQDDLAHVFLRWQQAGIRMTAAHWRESGRIRELQVPRPSMFRQVWYRALTIARLRRNNAGGFGAVIPVASSGRYG